MLPVQQQIEVFSSTDSYRLLQRSIKSEGSVAFALYDKVPKIGSYFSFEGSVYCSSIEKPLSLALTS